MKIRICLLVALLFTICSTGVFASAKKAHKLVDIRISAVEKAGKTHNKQHFVKRNISNLKLNLFKNRNHNNFVRKIDKPVLTVVNNKDNSQIDNKIVKFDFNEEIGKLSKHQDDGKNVILQLIKKNDADEKKQHGGGLANGGSDHVSSVPVPAAVWLFGSALLGLFGLRRKEV